MKVELINNCHVLDDAFMVMLQPSGRTAFFKEKVAEIYVSSKDQVRLAASSKFPGFAYDGDFVDVATNVKLIADCESPDRIERTLDALKDQFKR